jgi:hypothetical protein
MTEQKTQDPPVGGTEQPLPKGPSVEDRLAQLEADSVVAAGALTVEKRAREKAEAESRRLQADRDRARAKLETQQKTAANRPAVGLEELRQFANDKAREAALYKELNEAGLKEEDLPSDIEFSTPGELRAIIRIAQLDKKLVEQDQRLTQLTEAEKAAAVEAKAAQAALKAAAASSVGPDTGGPTRKVPAKGASDEPAALRKRAEELRAKGDPNSLQEARWLILGAAHRDPAKIIGRGSGGATEEG